MQGKGNSGKYMNQLFGLSDDAFVPRRAGSHTITKREVRAIALANLALHRDSTIWDVGSGTGSVAIEAARVASEGQVYAIECDTEALQAIEENCQRWQATNVTIVAGMAPEALQGLPAPDAIFVGGTGGRLKAILAVATERLHTGGHLVVNLASFEHMMEAVSVLRAAQWKVECTMVNIARSQQILAVTRFAALNPVFVLTASQADVRNS